MDSKTVGDISFGIFYLKIKYRYAFRTNFYFSNNFRHQFVFL